MLFSTILLAASASAFPNMAALMNEKRSPELQKRVDDLLAARDWNAEKRGYQGDKGAYAYQAPNLSGPLPDMRGPCPGLNTAANHGYMPRNGIPNAVELIQAQMNLYNIAPDLAALLVAVAMPLDGDIVTTRLSIGGDATSRTAALGGIQNVLGKEGGLIVHNTFEADTSLTRNDVFLGPNYENKDFNGTLYKGMYQTCQQTSGGNFDRACMTEWRYQRYLQSRAENGQFYFGIKSLLLYGASAFVSDAFNGNNSVTTKEYAASFFGTSVDGPWKDHAAGVNERIPKGWYPRNIPMTIPEIADYIGEQYFARPVEFGANVGQGNFVGAGLNGVEFLGGSSRPSQADISCALVQFLTDNYPSQLSGVPALTQQAKDFSTTLFGQYAGTGTYSGCPKASGQPVLSPGN
ncbi:hypothetical protein PYCC9005_003593 [Savitreella phatthalungensis]